MSRFRIHKTGDDWKPWEVDYPEGFEVGVVGEMHDTFNQAVEAFVKASERQCPMCLKGAVVDTDWGWECQGCGTYDTAVGRAQPASRDETNNSGVSQTDEDHPNIAHSAIPTPGIATTDRRRPCPK